MSINPMRKLKFGIAGYGKMGKIREKAIEECPDAEVVGIYDVNHQELRNKNIKFYNNFDELIASDIDAVIVSAYVKVAADYVMRALKAGKHVFCEKPPAATIMEMQEVLDVERASNKILKYGFNHRYHFSVQEAKKLINQGEMGRLLWMRGIYGKAGSIDFHKNWRNYKEYSGGGILIDQGIHMLDLMRYLAGEEFHYISGCLTQSYWNVECEDNAFLLLKSNSDVVATLHSTANQWQHKFLLEMTFEDGYINLDGILSSTRSYTPETMIVGRREFEDVTFAMGKPKETKTYFEYDKSWNYEIDEFISAIRGSSPVVNGTSKDALAVMKLVDDVYTNAEVCVSKRKSN